MNAQLTTAIMNIIVTLAAIALPAIAAYAYNKFKGNAKFAFAVKLIGQAITALKAYAVQHPEIIKDGQAIYNFVKARLLAVLPLTDEEFDYLFESIETAIAELLGVDISIFTAVKLKTVSTGAQPYTRKGILRFRKHHLFA